MYPLLDENVPVDTFTLRDHKKITKDHHLLPNENNDLVIIHSFKYKRPSISPGVRLTDAIYEGWIIYV